MKKWWAITGLLLLISGAVWANNITINATVLPADANILFDSYQWNIPLVNDGATPYQNDQQGVMTVKSGSTWIFHIQFSSANLGYVKQGTDKIAYYVKVTELADSYGGIIMSSDIMNGYVQLTSSKTIQFIGKTSKNGARFAVGIKVNALAGQFYESGVYTDTMTVTFFVF